MQRDQRFGGAIPGGRSPLPAPWNDIGRGVATRPTAVRIKDEFMPLRIGIVGLSTYYAHAFAEALVKIP